MQILKKITLLAVFLLALGICASAQVTVTGSTGANNTYPTLKDAFDAINAGDQTGNNVSVAITANTTETASATLNAGLWTTLTVRPTAAVTVSGNIVGAIIKLNSADNVTIDGRIGGTGTGRSLTVANTSVLGSTAAIWLASGTAAGSGATNNVIRNLELAGGAAQDSLTVSTFGIIMSGATISTTSNGVDNDNNSFIANRIIRVRYGIVTRGTTTDNSLNAVVTDNIVGPAAFGADQIGKTGILMQADTGANVSRNTVQFVGGCLISLAQTCTTGADRVGIGIGSESWSSSAPGTITSGDYTVTRNIIHDVAEERTFSAAGILASTTRSGAATNNLIANNFIYNVRSNGTSGDQVVGIGIAGGHTDRIVFNSISITGDMDPGTVGATSNYGNGIRIANASGTTHANLLLANNSIYMDVNSNTATLPYFDITINSATYSFGTGGLNYNNYYFPPANAQMNTGGISTNGTAPTAALTFNTLAQWRAALTPPQDANSIQADPQYVSNTADLHIAAASPNVNAGTTVAGVNTDIDGQVRVGVPDIGADEPAGVTPPANDIAANSLIFPTSGTTVGTGTAFAPQASFTNGGTATQTNVPVRYRITNSAMTVVCNVTATISAIDPGATVTVTFPTCTLTTAGTYTIQATSELVGDQTPGNDSISGTLTAVAPVGGAINVGTGGAFTNLTNSDGIFAALNAAGASSNVTINITSDLTAESGTVALNQLAGGFTVTIKPSGAARVISGSSGTAIIRLNDADTVTIDGSLTGGTAGNTVGGDATLRNLTVQNNSTSTTSAVIIIGSNTNGAQNNVVKNVNVIGNDPLTTFIGIQVGGAAVGAAGVDNDGNRVENCSFQKSTVGVYNAGASAANPNTGNVITKNEMAATAANRLARGGVLIFNQDGAQITLNNIGGIESGTGIDHYGIAAGIQDVNTTAVLSGGIVNTTIARNRIASVVSTSTVGFSAFGIGIAGGTTGANTIANNMISSIGSPATSPDIVAGIFVAGVPSSTTRAYYNSVSMNLDRGSTVTGQLGSYAIAISGTDPTVELKNNAVMNNQTSGGGANAKSYAIGTASTTFVNLDSNYNDLYTLGANAGFFRSGSLGATGTDYPNLAAWQTATGKDANSLEVNPQFLFPENLHIDPTSPLINVGTPIAAVTDDFDGQTRPATGVDIGADEIIAAVPGTLALSSATYTVAENVAGGTVTVTVNRTGGTDGAVAVNYALTNGTATGGATCAAGVDFVNTGGTVNFANGEASKTFTVAICNDTAFEGNETFNVTLSGATGGATIGSPSTAVVTITDDEMAQPGTLQLSAATYSVGEAGGTVTVTVNRTGGTDGAVGATYALTNGTAIGGATCAAGVDFVNTGGTVSFANGAASRTFTVAICNDTVLEGNETFNVTLSAPTGGATLGTPATAVVTIIDDEVAQPGTLALSSATYTVAENVAGGTVTVTVNRTGGTDGAVAVNYALTNGTATGGATCAAGVDFVNTGGTVSFANGEASKTFTVAICNDTVLEGNETFNVTLSGATGGATLGTPATATVTITDDEVAQPGTLQLSAATYTVAENVAVGTVTITVTRTGGTDGAVGATYALTNGTATGGATCAAGVDFVNAGGTVSFANGETSKTFTVAICDDTAVEGSETFNVVLSAPTGGATLGTPATAVVTITDNDTAPTGNVVVNPGNVGYATLKEAFDAINLGTHTGAVTVDIFANTTETATASLDASGVGTTSYTSVVVRPVGGARTVEGTITGAIVKLNGADNVTIDGRQGGTGTARDLTIRNNGNVAASAAVWLSSPAAGAGATNNIVRNLELACGMTNANANATFGIIMSGAAIGVASDGADNDNNQFVFNRIISARYGIVTRGVATNNNIAPIVSDNIIGTTAFGANGISKTGILMQADTDAIVSRNTVQFIGGDFANTSAGSDRAGIGIGTDSWGITSTTTLASGNYTVTRNIIHDVVEERTFSSAGIVLGTTRGGAATNNLVANNFVYNIRANGTLGDQATGIGISGGNSDSIVFNSISLTGDMDPTGSSAPTTMFSNGIRISAVNGTNSANFTVADNSILVDATSDTAAVHFYPITLNNANYSFGTGFLNYNNYFINPANPQLFTGGLASATGAAATTEFQTLANWRTALTPPQDANSIQADPQYVSNTADLHIAAASPNVNAGITINSVAQDIDGQLRVPPPDIGADEPGGTAPAANDIAAVGISAPATGSTIQTGTTITPQARFTNLGSATQTNVQVRFTITGPGFNYTDTRTIASIEPNQTVTVTFAATPTLTAVGTYTTTAAVITPDSNTANDVVTGSFNTVAPFTGNVNVGAGQGFTSLTNPGGIFEALNLAGASGNVTISITSDLTGETGTVALNELAGGFTVTIKPTGAARIISGSSAVGIIRLNDADNVTIDGSLTGGTAGNTVGGDATLRNLTVQNTTTANATVILIGSNVNGAQNNVVKNVNVLGNDPVTTFIGVQVGGAAVGTAGVDNDGNRIENCGFQKAVVGVYNAGASAANPNTGTVITKNEMTAADANRLERGGVLIFNQDGAQVTLNNIANVGGATGIDHYGIAAGIQDVTTTTVTSGGILNSTIARNRIAGVVSSSATGFASFGIGIAGGTTGANTIANNMISGVTSPAAGTNITAGIFVAGVVSSNTRVYYNSVAMTGERGAVASQLGSYAFAVTGADPTVELKNNIFYNTQTSGGGANAKSYSIGTASTAFANLDSNYNDFFVSGANAGFFRSGSLGATGTDYVNLAAWQAATGKDANSQEVDPLFVNPLTNLHLQATSPVLDDGIPIAAVTVDFDGEARSATTPDIGADEIVGTALQNGTLALSAATYTVGEAAGTVTVTVNRTNGSAGAVSATYSLANGTATGGAACGAGVDFVNTGGTVNFAAGETTKTFTVMICNDTVVESNETFTVTLAGATGGATIGTPATATVTIIDDDISVGPTLAINDVRVFEGDTGTVNAVFTVTASMTSTTAFTVNYATANNTATAGVDYVATSGTLTFAPGQTTRTITVQVIGDLLKEANETFFVNLNVPTGATIADPQGLGIIIDDDRAIVADFDNDGRTDLSVFRPSTGYWYSMPSSTGVLNFTLIGVNGDLPVPGDYDGDAKTDVAVFRPSNGTWYIQRSSDNAFVQQQWGLGTDKPVQGDFDGDGRTDIAVFRPSNGVWYVLRSSGGTFLVPFGADGDVPVQGDYDGDARTDYAVYRGGIWYVLNSSTNTVTAINFGAATDKPLVGDFDGDGKADFTVYRAGIWYIFQSQTGTIRAVAFGASTDIPIVGDYDGDGTSDIAVFRPSNGVWYVLRSSDNGFSGTLFGQNGDIPIPAGYQSLQ